MKILTGTLKGQPIRYRKGESLRPTSDKVRKALFDIVGPSVSGSRVLDLFAGTGALGLEALSRGAAWATFLERDKRRAFGIRENLKAFGLEKKALVLNEDASAGLRRLSQKEEGYDIIFLDPPYDKETAVRTLEALARSGLLRPESLVVLECARRYTVADEALPLGLLKRKTYGDTELLILNSKACIG